MIIDNIFDLVSYNIHPEPHIRIIRDTCHECMHKTCTFACPVRCYTWNETRGKIDFAYEACVECGTCLVVCDRDALEWNYPRGGYGVRFRLS